MPNPKKPRLYYERLSQMDLQLNREKTRLSLEQLKVNARVAIHDISGDFNHSGTTSVMDDSFEWWTLEEPPVGMKQYL
jgi:predicted solute-binding protein